MTNPRPFAPTANQGWVTTALAYLKETDLVSTRRSELSSARGSGDTQTSNSAATNQNAAAKKSHRGKAERESKPGNIGGDLRRSDEHRLEENISFRQLLSALPRWILRSKTKFSSFLARSFHISRSGTCPPSAVFPSPCTSTCTFHCAGCPQAKCQEMEAVVLQSRHLCPRHGLRGALTRLT